MDKSSEPIKTNFTLTVDEFATTLVKNHCFVMEKYRNEDGILQDVKEELRKLWDAIPCDYDTCHKSASVILRILMGIYPQYIGPESRQLDPRIYEIDLLISQAVEEWAGTNQLEEL